MRLDKIETFVTVPPTGIGGSFWVFVRITTNDGIEGVGECYGIPVSGDIAARMVEDTFDRFIAGDDPHNVEAMFRRVYSAGFTGRPDVTMMGVFSGIEMAVWDILGKAARATSLQPAWAGSFHERLRTYSYLYPEELCDPGCPTGDDAGRLTSITMATRQQLAALRLRRHGVHRRETGPRRSLQLPRR